VRVLDLFSGIGGFSLGLERAGMETVAFCEIEPYCQKVLRKHWPDVPIYEDVRDVSKDRLESDGITGIDVITGGFPCQDISVAGAQAGIEGERSGLWGELCRVIGDIRPRFAIVENVTALISGDSGKWFGRVLGDLAEIGYDCEWHCIPASELGAHHHRDRVWVIAYPNGLGGRELFSKKRQTIRKQLIGNGEDGRAWVISDTMYKRLQGREKQGSLKESRERCNQFSPGQICGFGALKSVEPSVRGGFNGLPRRVDRLKGLGNAVVPQIPELIGRAIMETYENP